MIITWDHPEAKKLHKQIVAGIVEDMQKEDKIFARIGVGSTEKATGALFCTKGRDVASGTKQG